MRRWFVRLLVLVTLAVSFAGCSPTIKQVHFQFDRNGTTIEAKKFFNDGFGLDPSTRAWPYVKQKKYAKAIEVMHEVCAADPDNAWARHNLAILYEATGDWSSAEKYMREAIAVDERVSGAQGTRPTRAFRDELDYILQYK